MCFYVIDPCKLYKPCHKYAYCRNTVDGYECTCKSGYFGNGTWCGKISYASGSCYLFIFWYLGLLVYFLLLVGYQKYCSNMISNGMFCESVMESELFSLINKDVPERRNYWRGSESSTLETDVYHWQWCMPKLNEWMSQEGVLLQDCGKLQVQVLWEGIIRQRNVE